MKLKSFGEFTVSENFKYHLENGIGVTDSVFRLGSDAYKKLFEETKKYWDEDNVILNDKEAWMVKNLEVGKKAIYDGREVELDTPSRGGGKKFTVYHNSGRKDKDGNIIAKKIEFGDSSGLSIKNDDPEAAASFWARQKCDTKAKMDPLKAGFWSCYSTVFFNKQLGLSSDMPW